VPPSHVRRLGRRRDHLNLAGPLPRPVVGERVDDRLGAAGTPDINLVLLGPTDDPAVFNMGRVPHHSVKPSWRTFELLPKSGRCDDKHAWRVTYDTAKPPGTCYDGC
jgi:hypothetical protein